MLNNNIIKLKYIYTQMILNTDSYITYATWVTDKQIALLHLNRAQNVSIISVCRANQFNCQDVRSIFISIEPI